MRHALIALAATVTGGAHRTVVDEAAQLVATLELVREHQ